MADSTRTESQGTTSTAVSKVRRVKASMFFKKMSKQEESLKNETIQRLREDNRKLRQKLNAANSRIRQLEWIARTNQPLQHEISLSPTKPIPVPSGTENVYSTRESVEYRDDDGDDEGIDESDSFSVEVTEAGTLEYTIEEESLEYVEEGEDENENEIHSITPSACTIPTGNDKQSNLNRHQREVKQRQRRSSSNSNSSSRSRRRGEGAYLDYFSRRSPPMERITEIDTRPSSFDDGDDLASTTSDLTASVASTIMVDDESINGSSLMSGRQFPLYAMNSLLRISSAESSAISFVPDEESIMFGEI